MSLVPLLVAVGQGVFLQAGSAVDPLRDRPILILCVFEFCLAGACITLWRAAPDFKVFRGLGAYFVLTGVDHVLQYFTGYNVRPYVGAFTSLILVEAAADALQETRRAWTRLLWPFYALQLIAGFVPALAFARNAAIDVSEAALFWISWGGLRRGGRVRLMAAAFALFTLSRLTISTDFNRLTSIPMYVEIAGWRTYVTSPVNVLLGILTLVVCFHDLLRDRREKQRLASEMEAARTVQQVLVPEAIPEVAGFAIESVYRPAGEVGGDFFQILPTAAGGVLIVIGDVSGKGMPAAMTVALLVGTVRTLAHFVQSPGEILAAMNQRMLARSAGGFTTCLVLRVDSDGTFTAANAGHLAPYLDGRELALENCLPLGLAPGTIYAESRFDLASGAQLTLLTDGVVEARDKDGRLFGFDRTAELSAGPAEKLTGAAQDFGQEDDITVVTVIRADAREPDLPPVEAPEATASA